MFEIPLKTYSSYVEQITLDGEQYTFKFIWNTRDSSYYLSIIKADKLLLAAVRLVVNWEVLHNYTNSELPKGSLFIIDQKSDDDTYVKEDFGNRIKLIYIPVGVL